MALLSTVSSCQPTGPPTLTKIFTAYIKLGSPSEPIPVPGGVRLIEPISGGNITGPAINGTITSGLAYPPVYNNGTLQVAEILVYGTTTDGYPFFVQEAGIGSNAQQITRIQVDVGGPYVALGDVYILAEINALDNRTLIMVDAYRVNVS
ncbi:hypothetical protein MMC17_003535 [Xylographa soralifera]|nr:hypothetical protein [Xylographa soralifera]